MLHCISETIFDCCSSLPFLHFYRSIFFISHLLSLPFFISRSFLPRTDVSREFACTVYWPHAERTQPSARFIRRTHALASAILWNFAREYEGAGESRASSAADAFERIPRMMQCMFIRNYWESFPQAACVDCFAGNRMPDVDMLAENLKLPIDTEILLVTIFLMTKLHYS